MARTRQVNPRLQEKLSALQRELSRVETDIKGISKAVDSPDPEEAMRRLRRVSTTTLPPGAQPVATRVGLHEPPKRGYGEDAFMKSPAGVTLAPPEGDAGFPKPPSDQRFATYFGSSSLHSVRPLRQERRVQRNKAIVMVILAGLLLYSVAKMLF